MSSASVTRLLCSYVHFMTGFSAVSSSKCSALILPESRHHVYTLQFDPGLAPVRRPQLRGQVVGALHSRRRPRLRRLGRGRRSLAPATGGEGLHYSTLEAGRLVCVQTAGYHVPEHGWCPCFYYQACCSRQSPWGCSTLVHLPL